MDLSQHLPTVRFANDLCKYLMVQINVNWYPLIEEERLEHVPKIFNPVIGQAVLHASIERSALFYQKIIGFSHEAVLSMDANAAFMYVKQKADKISSEAIVSFFITCAFMKNVSVFGVMNGRIAFSNVPFLALAYIMVEKQIGLRCYEWLKVRYVALILVQGELLPLPELETPISEDLCAELNEAYTYIRARGPRRGITRN